MTKNARHIQGKDGKMKGSIGKGKTAPTSSIKRPLKFHSTRNELKLAFGQPSQLLQLPEMLEGKSVEDYARIAKRKTVPLDVLSFIAYGNLPFQSLDHSYHIAVRAALLNPRLSDTELRKHLLSPDRSYRYHSAILGNPTLSAESIRLYVETRDFPYYSGARLAEACRHPNCPPKLVDIAIKLGYYRVTENRALTRDMRIRLLASGMNYLVLGVIRNPSTPPDLLHALLPDENGRLPNGKKISIEILRAVARFLPDSPERQFALKVLLKLSKSWPSEKLIATETSDVDVLKTLAWNGSWAGAHKALENPAANEELSVVVALRDGI